MKKLILTIIASSFLILGGCKTQKIDAVVKYAANLAPQGEEQAVDGWRIATIKNVGKVSVKFIGLYQEDGVIYAKSFVVEGVFTRYEGAPFAIAIPE